MQHLLFALGLILLIADPLLGQDAPAESATRSLEELVAEAISSESQDAWEAYGELFSVTGADSLSHLKRHTNASIAVQAAWETVLDTLTEKEREDGYEPHDRQALNRFVGFVEGRSRLAIPEWWADFVVKGPKKARPDWYHNVEQEFVFAPKDTRVIADDAHYILRISDESIKLPDSILDGARADSGRLWCRISGHFTDQYCFVAVHDDVGYPHKVACIDRRSCKLLWVSEACGCWIGGASGSHESWVEITVQGDQVAVYGASLAGFYVHSFNLTDGKEQFKFSTLFDSS